MRELERVVEVEADHAGKHSKADTKRAAPKIASQPVIFLQSYIYKFRPKECPMRTHRFGRKIKLPATIAIKHQIRMLMAQDEVKKAEAQLIEQSARRAARDDTLPLSALAQEATLRLRFKKEAAH
jgi:hypothetical protein